MWRDVLGALASTVKTMSESSQPPKPLAPSSHLSDEFILQMVSTACLRSERGRNQQREADSAARSLVDGALSKLDALAGSVDALSRDAAADR